MKNIKRAFLILVLFLLKSCVIKETPGVATVTTIFNNSGHNIEIQRFGQGTNFSSTFISNAESIEYDFPSEDGQGSMPPFFKIAADSIRVFYYEEASIWHTKAANQVVSKSLLLESSYQGGKVKDGLYEFTYTFTEDDFQEAVDFGD